MRLNKVELETKAFQWVWDNHLDTAFHLKYPHHDMTHALLGLSTTEEGLALAAEMILFEEWGMHEFAEFFDTAVSTRLDTDEEFSSQRVREIYDKVVEIHPIQWI